MALNFPADTSVPYIDSGSGLKYIYNGAVGAWEAAIQPPVISSGSAPNIDIEGFLWWDTAQSKLKVYVGSNWVDATDPNAAIGDPAIYIGETAPTGASAGNLWWNKTDGTLYVYYTDNDSNQWVPATPNVSGNNSGGVSIGNSAPLVAVEGDLWFNLLNNSLNIYSSNAWVTTQYTSGSVLTVTGTAPVVVDSSDVANPNISVTAATNTSAGIVQLANQAEVAAGTSTTRAVTPSALKNEISNILPDATDVDKGVVELATDQEAEAGVATDVVITPASLKAALDALGIGNPTGTVIAFASSQNIPSGYLECDGSEVLRASYPALYGVIGDVYTNDLSQSTHFNVPDLRGMFVRGWSGNTSDNTTVSIDSGRAFGSNQPDQNKSHTHVVNDPGHVHNITASTGQRSVADGGFSAGDVPVASDTNSEVTGITLDTEGGSESRPHNVAMIYCIKT